EAVAESGPAIAKWGLVLAHAPPTDQVGDLSAFAAAQRAAASHADGSVASAVALSAWEAGIPLHPPSVPVPSPAHPLEDAVLSLYSAMRIDPGAAERRELAESAA